MGIIALHRPDDLPQALRQDFGAPFQITPKTSLFSSHLAASEEKSDQCDPRDQREDKTNTHPHVIRPEFPLWVRMPRPQSSDETLAFALRYPSTLLDALSQANKAEQPLSENAQQIACQTLRKTLGCNARKSLQARSILSLRERDWLLSCQALFEAEAFTLMHVRYSAPGSVVHLTGFEHWSVLAVCSRTCSGGFRYTERWRLEI